MSETELTQQKVILITGCSSGIGLETAIECAKAGHKVFATMRDLNKSEELEKRKDLEQLKNIEIIKLDVSSNNSIEIALSTIIKKTNKIDVLFNNAGFMIMGSLEDLSVNEIQKQIDTDLLGPIYLTKNVIPHMRNNNQGLIINMSSIAGKIGFPLSSAYSISKFGIEGLTESLRRELVTKNINVCLIEAGIVNTKFFENMNTAKFSSTSVYAKDTQMMKIVIDKIKKEKWTEPIDIAKKVIEIIKENGKKCRYVVGDDALYLIDFVHDSKDDCEKIDPAIAEIMGKYLE